MKEKRIEEMAEDLKGSDKCKHLPKSICNQRHCSLCEAEILYELGYRKHIEGEWRVKRTAKVLHIKCSCCNFTKRFGRLNSITDEKTYILNDFIKEHRFCPNCGARMKGESK